MSKESLRPIEIHSHHYFVPLAYFHTWNVTTGRPIVEYKNGEVAELASHYSIKFIDRKDPWQIVAENMKDVLEAVALPPYKDSDLASLLETLRLNAQSALAKFKEMESK